MRHTANVRPGEPSLARRLAQEIEGEVLFDPASRGRYSTDASIYQIEPVGVVVPRNRADVRIALEVAREVGVAVLPRGAGTSQCGQTVGEALVIDASKHLNRIVEFQPPAARGGEGRSVTVEPGIVLDRLNAELRPHGLFFPVDVSTANRATIGGMAGNNSCGSRSIRYGNMVHNVRAISASLADGSFMRFGRVDGNFEGLANSRYLELVSAVRDLGAREADEVARRFPKLLRRVGGYNLDSIDPGGHNMADLLVGSEGTLAFFEEIELELQPIPAHRVLGICHFPTFYAAMQATESIVELDPSAVELVDRTLLDLAYDIDMFRPTLDRFVAGRPEALLFVEFSGETRTKLLARLEQLDSLLADAGWPGALVKVSDASDQQSIWDVRKAGLNIVMSMKGDGKPVSFVEDCAVRLADLPEYTRRLDEIFAKHGTRGTWYAHASVGTLHVRPILNMKTEQGAIAMRAIAEECFEMVREYEGSHSGEHGDGLVRSEFHEPMFGRRLVDAFADLKGIFDPERLFNPGKIVDPERMDDRSLFRFKPGYQTIPLQSALDWDATGGFAAAVEMCNNNGACRKFDAGVMCPSYRVTNDEQHVTRGRANTLRLALSNQLGADGFASEEVKAALDLCVGCKACRRECPTGVDMAKMKLEFLSHYHERHGWSARDRAIANLPRWAPWATRVAAIVNLANRWPAARRLGERWLGVAAGRELPQFRADAIRTPPYLRSVDKIDVLLFVDTFSRWFEPDNVRAAVAVLESAGLEVALAAQRAGERPLCCGRTFLATGQVDEARREASRLTDTLAPYLDLGIPILGLEPSCLYTLKDEVGALLPGDAGRKLAASAIAFERYVVEHIDPASLPLRPIGGAALVHGHCHQKSYGDFDQTLALLRLIPDLDVQPVTSSCCGMAGAFGYEQEHVAASMAMAERDLLPAVRAASSETRIVAGGTSCRHQIVDGSGRRALHPVHLLADACAGAAERGSRRADCHE